MYRNQSKPLSSDAQRHSNQIDFSFHIINNGQERTESRCGSIENLQTFYTNQFPMNTKMSVRKLSQKKLYQKRNLSTNTMKNNYHQMTMQQQPQQQEYDQMNKRLLEGFLRLRKQYLQGDMNISKETNQKESPSKKIQNSNKKNIHQPEAAEHSPLSQYEPVANIKLKLFRKNLKKSAPQGNSGNKGNKLVGNDVGVNSDQQEKYSLFDSFVSKCSYKIIDFSTQGTKNGNFEEQLSTALNSTRNINKQHSSKYISSNSKIISEKKQIDQPQYSSNLRDSSQFIYSTPMKESALYHFQPNELSTKMSLHNIEKSEQIRSKLKQTQYSFFQDTQQFQELNSSRSLSSSSQSSLIFSPAKEVDISKITGHPQKKKFEKIQLNFNRPKSQDSTLLVKKHNSYNQKQSTPDSSIYINIPSHHLIPSSDLISIQRPYNQKENLQSIRIENQTKGCEEDLTTGVLQNSYSKQNIKVHEKDNQLDKKTKENSNTNEVKSKRQYDLYRELSKELIKRESKESLKIEKSGLVEKRADQINSYQNDLFNNYLTSHTSNFIGKKLVNNKLSPEKRQDLLSQNTNRSSQSQNKKRQIKQIQHNQISDNIKEVGEKINAQNLKSATQKQFFVRRKISNDSMKVEESEQSKNNENSQISQSKIFRRKYSYDTTSKEVNKSFDIQYLNYRPIFDNTNKNVDQKAQEYFTNQMIRKNSIGSRGINLQITDKASKKLEKLCEERFQFQNLMDAEYKFNF